MKWRQTTRYSWTTDEGYTVAKFRVADKDMLGVTPPGARKPEFHGSRVEVLEWIENHKEGIITGTA